jgi:hypothetical protein
MRAIDGRAGAAALALLAGCSPLAEPTVRSALIDAGARPAVADCMAERMTDRLTLAQLRKLSRARATPEEAKDGLSAGEVLARMRRVGDAEAVAVTASAAALCQLSG